MLKKRLNPQVLIEILCYTVFSLLMLYLVMSDTYLSYITPRMEPYLIFTAITMAVWAGCSLRRLFQPKHRVRTAHCFVLVIPIVLILLPHESIRTSDLSAGYLNMNAFNITTGYDNNAKSSALPTISPKNDDSNLDADGHEDELYNDTFNDKSSSNLDTDPNEVDNILEVPEVVITLSGFNEIKKTITISDEEFYPWLSEIFTNMDRYEGYQVTIKGFVYQEDPGLKEKEFVLARLLMSCCSSDLAPCGILCQYDMVSELKADTWITVEGVIHKGKYMGNDEPQITVTKISLAEKPEEEYIYSY